MPKYCTDMQGLLLFTLDHWRYWYEADLDEGDLLGAGRRRGEMNAAECIIRQALRMNLTYDTEPQVRALIRTGV